MLSDHHLLIEFRNKSIVGNFEFSKIAPSSGENVQKCQTNNKTADRQLAPDHTSQAIDQ